MFVSWTNAVVTKRMDPMEDNGSEPVDERPTRPGAAGERSPSTPTSDPEATPLPDTEDNPFDELSVVNEPASGSAPRVAPGERLQYVRFARQGGLLRITGVTPHGRSLTFEQREDRQGWYVVAAARRRRPTERELGLVVASISQEMEAAMVPEDDREEVKAAFRLATAPDQPGLPVRGLQAYRDLLLDEAEAYVTGQVERLTVVAVEYQAFKRFAVRHGHGIGQAFVRALGERLQQLYGDLPRVHVCHKAGKSFRLLVSERTVEETYALIAQLTSDDTRRWLVHRVWGDDPHTHVNEVHFYIGFASARASERSSDATALAQRLNDDAYRAAKLGQIQGHSSLAVAKMDYRTTVHHWQRSSEDELEELASQMSDGPAEVMAEMNDFLHELVPVDLEGMAVVGDVRALIDAAIARDGFWQGSVAMRIAGERLLERFLAGVAAPEGENDHVGGFELGDEFYGMAREDGRFYFAWGDINSAGATRIRAGLDLVRHAVGWRRADGGGVIGAFLESIEPDGSQERLPDRVRQAAARAYAELDAIDELHVNDAVDMAGYLFTAAGEPAESSDLVEGAELSLRLPDSTHVVQVLERRAKFTLRLDIDGREHVAAFNEGPLNSYVKLRVRDAVVSASICILDVRRGQLEDLLASVREDNLLSDDEEMNVLGFLRHVADLILAEHVKGPGKIGLALGAAYDPSRFVQVFTLHEVRDRFPGIFYEAIHHELLEKPSTDVDRNLRDLIARTMLARTRPAPTPRA